MLLLPLRYSTNTDISSPTAHEPPFPIYILSPPLQLEPQEEVLLESPKTVSGKYSISTSERKMDKEHSRKGQVNQETRRQQPGPHTDGKGHTLKRSPEAHRAGHMLVRGVTSKPGLTQIFGVQFQRGQTPMVSPPACPTPSTPLLTEDIFPMQKGDFSHDGHPGLLQPIPGPALGGLHELGHLGKGRGGSSEAEGNRNTCLEGTSVQT